MLLVELDDFSVRRIIEGFGEKFLKSIKTWKGLKSRHPATQNNHNSKSDYKDHIIFHALPGKIDDSSVSQLSLCVLVR